MTDEQIKQNAEGYAKEVYDNKLEKAEGFWGGTYNSEDITDAFIEGAHSRDKEIYYLKRDIEELQKMVKMRSDAFECARKEIERLRNSWISVEERLPETGADIIYLMNSCTPGLNERYRMFDSELFRMNVRHWQYTNDPELKEGE